MTQSSVPSTYELIPGGSNLLKWFGRVPSFHDAEVLDLHLRREGNSTLTIHTWNITDKVRNGYFVLEKHAVVEFSIGRIVDLTFEGFNHQNVIFGLELSRVKLERDKEVFELAMEPCFGMAGSVRAEELSVRYTAGEP